MTTRKITLRGGFSGKVSTGSYENSSPLFGIEETIENFTGTDEELSLRLQFLTGVCKRNFDLHAQMLTIERIEKERKEIRFYEHMGRKYPSVTSILDLDSEFRCSKDDLAEYAAQGQITHARVSHLIKTGLWVKPMDLSECWPYCHTLKTGKLGLNADSGDFQAFLKKYPITDMVNGAITINTEHEYAGTPDFIGIPQFKDADEVLTLFDVKRSVMKAKNFMQMAAYAVPHGIKQLAIVPLNDETEQKFSKPVVTKDVDQYFEMFLAKRREFRKRFSI